ncbi:MAG: uroporphyrinogen-III C-methyltransferase [Clostridiales bacterium]|nr:uroporphyrinogen-III C-methyltransferase [Clostridiales bacterium]
MELRNRNRSDDKQMDRADLAGEGHCLPVSLVGAGPGDAGLLTRKGLERIRRADVVIYDNLISGSILNEARLDAELVYVGKREGMHAMSQEAINGLLVRYALAGKAVVRLKGGDPFVFGRGGEEALALAQHGIPYEIVPGVSSAYSAPAYAGIPVTHRGLASSFHVITGHEGGGKAKETVDYSALARCEGTLVFLMGLRRLGEIADRLIAEGKDPATPAAVVENGTTSRQRVLRSDLGHVAEDAAAKGMQTPAITVVGPVAALHEGLDWFGKGALAGTRVLATGTRSFCRELEKELQPAGAETVTVSLIESRPLWLEQMRDVFAHLERYQWMVFTSGNGVELFFAAMKRQGMDLRRLMHLKFAAIGQKTAEVLATHGFRCDFVPESFSSADLAREWIPTLARDEQVVLMRAKEGSPVLPEKLREAGVSFTDVSLYETWVDERRREEVNRLIGQVDYVTVASASAVRALASMLDSSQKMTAKLISIGPSTTKAAREAGLSVCGEAAEYTAEGICAAILADAETVHEPCTGGHGYFPLFVDLTGKKIRIVGAGSIASRRAAVLADFGAEILVTAPEGTQEMENLDAAGRICWVRRPFETEDLENVELVLAATDDAGLNAEIVRQCRERGIPVNDAGEKEQCDFYFPAIARKKDVVIGVTASGTDHRLVRRLTANLREWLREKPGSGD